MKSLFFILYAIAFSTVAYAACATSTVGKKGNYTVCTTCCENGECKTVCN